MANSLTSRKSLPLSVIIPTHRRPQSLAKVLRALAQQTFSARDFEVVVVIDGPDPETERILEGSSFPFDLRWFTQPARGAPAARNWGTEKLVRNCWFSWMTTLSQFPSYSACTMSGTLGKKG